MMVCDLIDSPQYDICQSTKEQMLLCALNELCEHHRRRCREYDRLIEVLYPDFCGANTLASVPYIPVGLFKSHLLRSVPESEIFKILTSSGTSGQSVSRIALDRETARRQTIALGKIMTSLLGPERLPMLIVDSKSLLADRARVNARTAAVVGMMNFGRDHVFALDSEMRVDWQAVHSFLRQFGTSPFFVFGFTFLVWQHLVVEAATRDIDLSQGILLHGGGWKKMQELSVSNDEFKRSLRRQTGLRRVHNYYGLIEQVGGIYVEDDEGYLRAPNFTDVIIRDPSTWQETEIGQPGVIQVLSVLPTSYPGHSILTEDIGILHDAGGAGRENLGKRFSVVGRAPKAELRGCSDVYASTVS